MIDQKARARAIAYTLISTEGRKCERCGSDNQGLHRHHDDYNRPLDVRFLCQKCHARVHPISQEVIDRSQKTRQSNLEAKALAGVPLSKQDIGELRHKARGAAPSAKESRPAISDSGESIPDPTLCGNGKPKGGKA